MAFDNDLIAAKLRRWEQYLLDFKLPKWNEIPDIGLYMEQLIQILGEYLDYLPPELKEEQFVTSATINNYVRTKVMPAPIKKRYYREHIAYLIVILMLKQNMNIAQVQSIMPVGISSEEVQEKYTTHVQMLERAKKVFLMSMRALAGPILKHDDVNDLQVDNTDDLILLVAMSGGFNRLLTDKLLLLNDVKLSDRSPEDLEIRHRE